ncbi:MAG: hypothetical protein ACLVJ6_12045 [Merdibacter sp.]
MAEFSARMWVMVTGSSVNSPLADSPSANAGHGTTSRHQQQTMNFFMNSSSMVFTECNAPIGAGASRLRAGFAHLHFSAERGGRQFIP